MAGKKNGNGASDAAATAAASAAAAAAAASEPTPEPAPAAEEQTIVPPEINTGGTTLGHLELSVESGVIHWEAPANAQVELRLDLHRDWDTANQISEVDGWLYARYNSAEQGGGSGSAKTRVRVTVSEIGEY